MAKFNKVILSILTVITAILFLNLASATDVSVCGTTLNSPGIYNITADLSIATSNAPCLTITSSDVILDGMDYSTGIPHLINMAGTITAGTGAIRLGSGIDNLKNITIINTNFTATTTSTNLNLLRIYVNSSQITFSNNYYNKILPIVAIQTGVVRISDYYFSNNRVSSTSTAAVVPFDLSNSVKSIENITIENNLYTNTGATGNANFVNIGTTGTNGPNNIYNITIKNNTINAGNSFINVVGNISSNDSYTKSRYINIVNNRITRTTPSSSLLFSVTGSAYINISNNYFGGLAGVLIPSRNDVFYLINNTFNVTTPAGGLFLPSGNITNWVIKDNDFRVINKNITSVLNFRATGYDNLTMMNNIFGNPVYLENVTNSQGSFSNISYNTFQDINGSGLVLKNTNNNINIFNNTFTNVTNDLELYGNNNSNLFFKQLISNMKLSSAYGNIVFLSVNLDSGPVPVKVDFNETIVNISSNLAFYDGSSNGPFYNYPSGPIITLLNIPVFTTPGIWNDTTLCGVSCTNSTPLVGNVTFTAPFSTSSNNRYYIGESDTSRLLTLNTPLVGSNYNNASNINFNCSAVGTMLNVTLVVDGLDTYTIYNSTQSENLTLTTTLNGFTPGTHSWTCRSNDIVGEITAASRTFNVQSTEITSCNTTILSPGNYFVSGTGMTLPASNTACIIIDSSDVVLLADNQANPGVQTIQTSVTTNVGYIRIGLNNDNLRNITIANFNIGTLTGLNNDANIAFFGIWKNVDGLYISNISGQRWQQIIRTYAAFLKLSNIEVSNINVQNTLGSSAGLTLFNFINSPARSIENFTLKNSIFNSTGTGVGVTFSTGSATQTDYLKNILIENNTFECGQVGFTVSGNGTAMNKSQNFSILNNHMKKLQTTAQNLFQFSNMQNIYIINNSIIGNEATPITHTSSSPSNINGFIMKDNIIDGIKPASIASYFFNDNITNWVMDNNYYTFAISDFPIIKTGRGSGYENITLTNNIFASPLFIENLTLNNFISDNNSYWATPSFNPGIYIKNSTNIFINNTNMNYKQLHLVGPDNYNIYIGDITNTNYIYIYPKMISALGFTSTSVTLTYVTNPYIYNSSAYTFTDSSAYLNTTSYPQYNFQSKIYLNNTPTGLSNPTILVDGLDCSPSICLPIDDISDGNALFTVTQWDGVYTIGEGAPPSSVPSIIINSPLSVMYNFANILLQITSNGNYVWYNVNNGANTTYTTPLNITFVEGLNTIVAYANNSIGENSTTITFTVDTIPPSININSPQNNQNYTNRTQILSITSNGDNIWYNWNGTNVTYTNPLEILFNSDGNTLIAYANDSAGNINSAQTSFQIASEVTDIVTPNAIINFTTPVETFQTNISEFVTSAPNYIAINTISYPEYNVPAQVVLYNVPTNFTHPGIFRNGVHCAPVTCPYTGSLNSGNVTFNVPGWSNYTIGELSGLEAGLLYYYGFNNNLADIYAGNNLTNFTSANNYSFVTGGIGGTNRVRLVDTGLVSLNNSGISGSSNRTMSFWSQLNETSSYKIMVQLGYQSLNNVFGASQNSGSWFLQGNGGANDYTFGTANTSWNHHVITYNGTTALWYINGVLTGTFVHGYSTTDTPISINNNFYAPNAFINNLTIDELGIWNRPLNQSEINMLYNKVIYINGAFVDSQNPTLTFNPTYPQMNAWNNYRTITIGGNSTNTSTVFYITVPYISGMATNYGDLRFTNSLNQYQLPYYIESYNSTSAQVRVLSNSTSINIWYNGPTNITTSSLVSVYGSNLVTAYPLDEAIGSTTSSVIGYGNNLTSLVGNFTTGKIGNAYNPNAEAKALGIYGGNLSTTHTVSLWFKNLNTSNWGANYYRMFAASSAWEDGGWGITTQGDGGSTLFYTAFFGGSAPTYGNINDGRFHNVIVSANFTTNKFQVYLDGVQVGVNQSTSGTANDLAKQFYLFGAGGSPDMPYNTSLIDDVMLFNSSLTSTQISALSGIRIENVTLGAEQIANITLPGTTYTPVLVLNRTDNSTIFHYMKQISNLGGNIVTLRVDKDNNMQDDWDDLRFLNTNNVTLPYFKIYSNSTQAIYKVQTNQSSTIYMYYGNPSATYAGNIFDIYGTDLKGAWFFEDPTNLGYNSANASNNYTIIAPGLQSIDYVGSSFKAIKGEAVGGLQGNYYIAPSDNITFMIYGKINNTGQRSHLIGFGDVFYSYKSMYMDPSSQLKASFGKGSSPTVEVAKSADTNYHLYAVVANSGASGQMKLYIDNSTNSPVTQPYAESWGSSTTEMTIGVFDPSYSFAQNNFSGILDDGLYFNAKLTDAQIDYFADSRAPNVTYGNEVYIDSPVIFTANASDTVGLQNATLTITQTVTGACYQETANISTACGGLNTGVYSVNATSNASYTYDGNYNTFGDLGTYGSNPGTYYVNYTLPAGVQNTSNVLQWKTNIGIRNDTIPVACIANKTKLQLKIAAESWSAGCFPDGLVTMADGTFKDISEIKVGDSVLSWDNETGQNVANTVIYVENITTNPDVSDPIMHINGNLNVTPNHWLYINGKWVQAAELKVGDTIMDSSFQQITVTSLTYDIPGVAVPIYSIEVNNTHTYYVNGYLVHNSGGGGGFPPLGTFAIGGGLLVRCWDGSSFSEIVRVADSRYLYEEAMFWNLGNSTVITVSQTTVDLGGVAQQVISIPVVLVDGIYNWFWSVFNLFGNQEQTSILNSFNLEATYPQISFVGNTPTNGENYSNNPIYFEISTDQYADNLSVYVYGNVNVTVPSNLTTSLVAYWNFDNSTSGGVDVVRGVLNASLSGTGNTSDTGKIGGGWSTDGGGSNYVATTAPAGYLNTSKWDGFTLNFWLREDTNCGGSCNTDHWEAPGYYTVFNYLDDLGGSQKIWSWPPGSINVISSGGDLPVGTWHMISATWNRTSLVAYLDGNYVGTAATTSFPDYSGLLITLLAQYQGGTSETADEYGVWNKSLSSSEISQLYNSGNGLSYPQLFNTVTVNGLVNSTVITTPVVGINYVNLGVPSDGYYTFWANATNPGGLVNSTEVRSILVDTAAPVINPIIPYNQWWNSTWRYRASINITETSNANLSNYTINFTVPYLSGKMNSNYSDLRFVDSTNTIKYNYWIESSNATSANVYVKVASIPALSNTVFYMYYGNVNATSESSIDNAFLFADNFNTGSLNTTKWINGSECAASGCGVSVINNALRVYRPAFSTSNLGHAQAIGNYIIPNQPIKISWTENWTYCFNSADLNIGTGTSNNPIDYYYNAGWDPRTATYEYGCWGGNPPGAATEYIRVNGVTASGSPTVNQNYSKLYVRTYVQNGYANRTIYESGVFRATNPTSLTTTYPVILGFSGGASGTSMNVSVDNFIVQAYATSEPVLTFGSEFPVNTYYSSNNTVNFTANVTDGFGIKNATLSVYNNNTNAIVYTNTTTYSPGTLVTIVSMPITLIDGIYNWFWSIFDWADNQADFANQTLYVDGAAPNISFVSPTYSNGVAISNRTFPISVSINETFPNNFTINLWNSMYSNYTSYSYSTNTNWNGLQVYYNLNEGTGTNGIDTFGLKNITFSDSLWGAGKISGARNFSGSDYGTTSYNFPSGNSNKTVSLWFKKTGATGTYRFLFIAGGMSSARDSFGLYLDPSENLVFSSYAMDPIITSSVTANIWHNIILTYGGGNNVTAYYDGQQVNLSLFGSPLNTGSTYPLTFGRRPDTNNQYFTGQIDEFAIFNRYISPSEASYIYNSGTGRAYELGTTYYYTVPRDGLYYYNATISDIIGRVSSTETRNISIDTTTPTINSTNPINSSYTNTTNVNFTANIDDTATNPLFNGVVRYYTLDEVSGNAIESRNGVYNLSNGAGVTQGVTGKLGTAYRFTTATNSYSTAAQTGMPLGTNSRTVNYWVYTTANPDNYAVALFYGDNTGTGTTWRMRYLTTPNMGFSGNGADWDNVFAVGNNAWHMITLQYNGTHLQYYYDGVSQGTQAVTLNTDAGNACFMLGGENFGCEASKTTGWAGTLDEIGIWNRTLSSSEVSQLYNGGAGLYYIPYNYSSGLVNATLTVNGTLTNGTVYNNQSTVSLGGLVTTVVSVPIGLFDGVYNWFWSTYDRALNLFTTPTYTTTIDTTNPGISFISPTYPTGSNLSSLTFPIVVNTSDVNQGNITFNIYNSGWSNSSTYQFGVINYSQTSSFADTLGNATINGGPYGTNAVGAYGWSAFRFTATSDYILKRMQIYVSEYASLSGVPVTVGIYPANATNGISDFTIVGSNSTANSEAFTVGYHNFTWATNDTIIRAGRTYWIVFFANNNPNFFRIGSSTYNFDCTGNGPGRATSTGQPITALSSAVCYGGYNGIDFNIQLYGNIGTAYPTTFTVPTDGVYYYNVTTTDLANNFNTTETRQITLDTHDPNVIITSPIPTSNDYLYYKVLNISNPQSYVYQNLTTVTLTIDTASLITAGKMRSDCADLEITYNNVTSQRLITNCNSANTNVTFNLKNNINASKSDSNYMLKYGLATDSVQQNNDAGTNVYIWKDYFTSDDGQWMTFKGEPGCSALGNPTYNITGGQLVIYGCSASAGYQSWVVRNTTYSLASGYKQKVTIVDTNAGYMDILGAGFNLSESYMQTIGWPGISWGGGDEVNANWRTTYQMFNGAILFGAIISPIYANPTKHVFEMNSSGYYTWYYNSESNSSDPTSLLLNGTIAGVPAWLATGNKNNFGFTNHRNTQTFSNYTMESFYPTAPTMTLGSESGIGVADIDIITNQSQTNFTVNITDLYLNTSSGLSNATITITNSTGIVNQTTTTLGAAVQALVNIPIALADGFYNWFWNVFDFAGNEAATNQNNTILVDTTTPLISFISPTYNSGVNISSHSFPVGLNITETNPSTLTYNVFNSTWINSTTVNITSLNPASIWNSLSLYYNGNSSEEMVSGIYDLGIGYGNASYTTSGAKLGKSMIFTSGDGLTISDGAPTIELTGTSSLSFWFKSDLSQTNNQLITKYNGGGVGYYIEVTNSGFLEFAYFNNGGGDCSWPAGSVTANNWTMVTLVRSGTTTSTYRNGQYMSNCTGTLGATSANLYLGRNSFGSYLDGGIDEVGFWSRVLTQSEIQQLYNSNIGTTYSSGMALPSSLSVPYDGVYYYNATTTDIIGHFNTTETRQITLDTTAPNAIILAINNISYGGYCYQETANVSTACGGLNTGTYSDSAGSVYMNYTKPTNAMNSSLWQVRIGLLGRQNYSIPVSCWNYDSSKLSFRLTSATSSSNAACYNGTTWVTVASNSTSTAAYTSQKNAGWVYDGDWDFASNAHPNTGAVLYASGAWQAAEDDLNPNTDGGILFEEAMVWNINLISNNTYYNYTNQTFILNATDNIALNSATLNIIGQLVNGQYVLNPTLKHQWRFDETTNTTLYDTIGTVNLSGLNGSMIPGKIGNAYSMDGVNRGQVSIDQTPTEIGNSTSISMWFRRTNNWQSLGVYPNILSTGGSANNWGLYANQDNANGGIFMDGGNCPEIASTTNNTWMFLTMEWDFTNNRCLLYKDGVLQGNMSYTSTYGGYNITLFGSPTSPSAYSRYMDIDDLRIYNKLLSQSEILEIYNSGAGNQTAGITVYNNTYVNTTTVNLGALVQTIVSIPVALTDGVFNWFWNVYDWAGNLFTTTPTYTTTIDTVSGTITISYPVNNTNYTNIIPTQLNATIYDVNPSNLTMTLIGTSTLNVFLANTTWYNSTYLSSNPLVTGNVTINNILATQGYNNWTLTYTDYAGHITQSMTRFFVDTINPTISFISYTDGDLSYQNRSYIAYNVTTFDVNYNNLSIIAYNTSGAVVSTAFPVVNQANYTISGQLSGLQDGNHTIVATSCDVFSHCTNTSRLIFIDLIAPVISFTAPTPAANNLTTAYDYTALWANVTVTDTYPNLTILNIGNNGYSNTQNFLLNYLFYSPTATSGWATNNGMTYDGQNGIYYPGNTTTYATLNATLTITANYTAYSNYTLSSYNGPNDEIRMHLVGGQSVSGPGGSGSGGISGLIIVNQSCINMTSKTMEFKYLMQFITPGIVNYRLECKNKATSQWIDTGYLSQANFPGGLTYSQLTVNDEYLTYGAPTTSSFYNWTGLADGTYNITGIAYDKVGRISTMVSRLLYITGNAPTNMTYTSPTPGNNSGITLQYIPINVTLVEPNIQNITFRLYGPSQNYTNSSTSYVQNFYHQFVVPDGQYTYNAIATDIYGHQTSLPTQLVYKEYGTGNTSICKDLSFPGTYTVIRDLNSTAETCFDVKTSGVTLDCMGHSITMTGNPSGIGIRSSMANTVIKNCNIYTSNTNGTGVKVLGGNTNIQGSLIDGFYGIFLNHASLTMTNDTIANNVYGLYMTSESTLTIINETGGRINSSNPYRLAKSTAYHFRNPVILAAYNSTGSLIGAGNYTVTSNGTMLNATSTTYNNVKISYTYVTDLSDTFANLNGVIFNTNTYGIYQNHTGPSPGGSSGSQVWGPSSSTYTNVNFTGTATDIITLLYSDYNNFNYIGSTTGGEVRYTESSNNYVNKGTLGTGGVVLTSNSKANTFRDTTYSGTESVDSTSVLYRSWTTTITTKDSGGNTVGGTTVHVNDGSNKTVYTNPDGTVVTDINQYVNNGTVTVFNPYEIFGVLTDYGNSLFTDTQITTVDDETQVDLTFGQQIRSTLLTNQVMKILLAIILLIGLAASTGFFVVKMRDGQSVADIWKYFIIMIIWDTIFLVLFLVMSSYIMGHFYPSS